MRVIKGIYELTDGYVVKIRRRGQNYSKVFKFYNPDTSTNAYPAHLDREDSKRKALDKALEWQKKELNSVLGQGVKSSQNADYLTLEEILNTYKAKVIDTLDVEDIEKPTRASKQQKDLEVWSRAVERAKAIIKKSILSISKEDWAKIRDRAVNDGYANATVNKLLQVFSSAFKYYRTEKHIDIWFPRELLLPINDRKMITTDEKTVELIINQVGNSLTQKAIWLCFYTGARRSEIHYIRYEYIDFENGIITLPSSKNDDPRTLYLNKKCIAILKSLGQNKNGYIFSNDDGKTAWHCDTITRAWTRARNRVYKETQDKSILQINLHSLRHTFITKMVPKIESDILMMKVSGHRDIRSLQRYDHSKGVVIKKKISKFLE